MLESSNTWWGYSRADHVITDEEDLLKAMDKLWRECALPPVEQYIAVSKGVLRMFGRATSMTRFQWVSAEQLTEWGIPHHESKHGFGDGERQFYHFDKRRLKRLRRRYARIKS